MNTVIFTERLQECRRRKFSSQQAFADAYMERYGMIRKARNDRDNNMFGTIQSWEQGKSTPTAEVLANICDLLECDADYLLGRIDQRTHDINDAHRFTGLSAQALEQLHEYRESLATEPNWAETRELEERWGSHRYYQAHALYLIDELLVGSQHHKLSVHMLDRLFTMIYEEGIGVSAKDYLSDDGEEETLTADDRELYAAQCKDEIETIIYRITSNIRDILYENAVQEKFPPALRIDTSKGTYFFSINK